MNDKEPSILKNSIIIQAVVNIVKNSDLLNDIDRITARTLLESALSNGGIININDLAKGINSMVLLSEDIEIAKEEYNSVQNIMDMFLDKALASNPEANISIKTGNYYAESIISSPYIEKSQIIGRLSFSNIKA